MGDAFHAVKPLSPKNVLFSWRLPPRELPSPPARVNPYTQSFYQTMRKLSRTCSDKRCQYHIWKSASSSGARASLPLPELPTYDAHKGGIIIHKAAKKAFDELALKKLPTVNLLQAEYSDLLVQKKLDYAALAKAREKARQLQIYKANEETRMPRNSGRQGSINRKNSTALQGVAEGEPFDQSGGWGEFPQQAAGRFPTSGNLPVRQVCINAGIACQA